MLRSRVRMDIAMMGSIANGGAWLKTQTPAEREPWGKRVQRHMLLAGSGILKLYATLE